MKESSSDCRLFFNDMKAAPRIVYIDLLKCFAIFLVVLGHSCDLVDDMSFSIAVDWNIIMPFHMPLFAILSGYFFKNSDNATVFLNKKIRQLIIPLLFWNAIIWIVPRLIHDGYESLAFGTPIYFKAILRNFFYGVTEWNYWFLKALFFCFLLLYLILRLCHNRLYLSIIMSCLVVYIFSFFGIIPNKMPLLQGFIFLYPFFCMGYVMKQHDDWIKYNLRKMLYSSGIVFVFLLFLWKGEASAFYAMNTSALENQSTFDVVGIDVVVATFYRFLVGVCGSLFCIASFRLMFENIHENRCISLLSAIGKSTLAIYILQAFFFDNVNTFLYDVNKYVAFMFVVLISVMVVIVCFYLQKLSLRLPVKIQTMMWGKG